MKISFRKTTMAVLIGCALVFGCAQTPLKVTPIAKTAHPSALANKLGEDLAAAKARQVDVLSPTWFARAKASHAKASDGLKKGSDLSAILDSIATGNAQLMQAEKYAENSRYHLKDVIDSRNAAHKAGAEQFGKEFTKLERKFFDLTESVEEGDLKSVVSGKKSVQAQYKALELQAIKQNALSEVRQMLRQARDEDMDETAPKSYLMAKSKLDEADAFITRDRYAVEGIAEKVRIARFYARRMTQMTKTSLKLEQMAPEEIALWMENYLYHISSQLKGTDRRDIAFDAQEKGILEDIVYIKENRSASAAQLEAKNAEVVKLNQRIADLEGSTYKERSDKERLAAEKKFNELYNKVQGYFSAEQAEVYKKGQQLVIRLKAIQFPVGQSVIVTGNYALLKTVQKSIATFGRPDVIIEGHTDSTGSAATNQALSQSRAEAVKQYLLANGTLPENKLVAIGYGSSRPLASNKTAEGRAINRRIDVLIKPYMQ
jgi:OmpA-OmpF porin, OOP family